MRLQSANGSWIAGSLLLVLLALMPVQDSIADVQAPVSAEQGKLIFGIYCGNCHGKSAKGDGPTAELLKVRPRDLTRLSRGNGGEFPTEDVYRVIDGRQRVSGHGTGQMPIWGLGFQQWDTDVNQEHEVRGKILQLIEYLKTVQGEE